MVPIIGLDVDDVLCNFRGRFLNFYNKKFFTNFKLEDLNSDDTLYNCLGIDKYLARSLYRDFFIEEWKVLSFFSDAASVLGKNSKCQFVIISHRRKYLEGLTEHWAKEVLGSSLISTKCLGDEDFASKGVVAKRNACDFFVEDNLSVAYDVASHGVTVFLLNYPWNQKDDLPKNIIRVNSWKDIGLLLDRYFCK